MKNRWFLKILLSSLILLLAGCEKNNESTVAETSEMNFTVKSESEVLLDAFLASEIPAI